MANGGFHLHPNLNDSALAGLQLATASSTLFPSLQRAAGPPALPHSTAQIGKTLPAMKWELKWEAQLS